MICKIKNFSFIPLVVPRANQDESQIQSGNESETHVTKQSPIKYKYHASSPKDQHNDRMISPEQTQSQIEHQTTKKSLKNKKSGIDTDTDVLIAEIVNKAKKVLSVEKLQGKQNKPNQNLATPTKEDYSHQKQEKCIRNVKVLSVLTSAFNNEENLDKSLKSSYEYFKPKIVVEMSELDDPETVTEIHIKGWKIEKPMMETLKFCLPHIERLNTIKLVL